LNVILYLAAIVAVLFALQTVVFLAFKQPLQWTFGHNSQHPKSLKLAMKVVLQGTLIGSIFLYPHLVGSTPGAFYGPLFRADHFHLFWYGEAISLALLILIYGIEVRGKWLYWKQRWPWKKTLSKCLFSALSSLTVVLVEEPLFRGVIQRGLIAALPLWVALPLGAAVFSLAHFIRKVPTYWPAVGLGVLGLWLGVAYYKTGSLWLPMGIHSGGILSIGVHRCFLNYRGPQWIVGTQTFPVAGAVAITVMLVGTVVTWFLF
jgi:membrane protease YdiL (CAAX protease family)